mgnify:CR=1 FL=1
MGVADTSGGAASRVATMRRTGTATIVSARLDPMTTPSPLPVTGAWLPGDEPGHRQFFTVASDRRFALDCGVALSDVVLA